LGLDASNEPILGAKMVNHGRSGILWEILQHKWKILIYLA